MNTTPDLTTAAVKMFFSLGLVLLFVWGLYRFTKGKLPTPGVGGKHKYIQVVESQYLGVKKSVAMVKVPGSVLVVGIGANDINLLAQIDDPDLLEALDAPSRSKKSSPILGFKDHLNRLTKKRAGEVADSHIEKVTE